MDLLTFDSSITPIVMIFLGGAAVIIAAFVLNIFNDSSAPTVASNPPLTLTYTPTTTATNIWLHTQFDATTARLRKLPGFTESSLRRRRQRISTSPVTEEDWLEDCASHNQVAGPTTIEPVLPPCQVSPTDQISGALLGRLGKPTCAHEFDEDAHRVMKDALSKIRLRISGGMGMDDEGDEEDGIGWGPQPAPTVVKTGDWSTERLLALGVVVAVAVGVGRLVLGKGRVGR
ncbi:hypothetical protein HDU93_000782 [Gonapodya sp. JEL0774]|nr:hypothetical protein HDU93_000782 [Gonapodya sp. JEL0774]